MLKLLNEKVREPEIVELLSYREETVPEALEQRLIDYTQQETLNLYGFYEDEMLKGIIGARSQPNDTYEITDIAVVPEERHKGIGQGLLYMFTQQTNAQRLITKVDEDAVDFYRAIGFEIYSLGISDIGIEQFQCEWKRSNNIQS